MDKERRLYFQNHSLWPVTFFQQAAICSTQKSQKPYSTIPSSCSIFLFLLHFPLLALFSSSPHWSSAPPLYVSEMRLASYRLEALSRSPPLGLKRRFRKSCISDANYTLKDSSQRSNRKERSLEKRVIGGLLSFQYLPIPPRCKFKDQSSSSTFKDILSPSLVGLTHSFKGFRHESRDEMSFNYWYNRDQTMR